MSALNELLPHSLNLYMLGLWKPEWNIYIQTFLEVTSYFSFMHFTSFLFWYTTTLIKSNFLDTVV